MDTGAQPSPTGSSACVQMIVFPSSDKLPLLPMPIFAQPEQYQSKEYVTAARAPDGSSKAQARTIARFTRLAPWRRAAVPCQSVDPGDPPIQRLQDFGESFSGNGDHLPEFERY